MDDGDKKMVRVACRIPNGFLIRLQTQGFDDGTGDGVKPMVHDGPGVRLNGPSALHTGAGNTERADLEPGVTLVDAEWFARWLEQRQGDEMVKQRHIYALDDDPEKKGENPTA